MITLEYPSAHVADVCDELFSLQLRVARRADELALGVEPGWARDVVLWFRAEREILRAHGLGIEEPFRSESLPGRMPQVADRSKRPEVESVLNEVGRPAVFCFGC